MKKTVLLYALLALFLTASSMVLIGSNGSILGSATNQVSIKCNPDYRWEPSSAAAPDGSSFATSWAELFNTPRSYASILYSGASVWTAPRQLVTPESNTTGDVNLAWDASTGTYAAVMMDVVSSPSIWFARATDSTAFSWTYTRVFAASGNTTWDYPTVGIDASGQICVAATKVLGGTTPVEYHSICSNNNGASFDSTTEQVLPTQAGSAGGSAGRLVAAESNKFHFFFFYFSTSQLAYVIDRYELACTAQPCTAASSPWRKAETLPSFTPGGRQSFYPYARSVTNDCPNTTTPCPACVVNGNDVSNCYAVYYGPLLDAAGGPDGTWAVAFKADLPNVMCVNYTPCTNIAVYRKGWAQPYFVNPYADDQFMYGAAVASDGSVWVGYLTYHVLSTQQMPLYSQAISVPADPVAGPWLGGTGEYDIDPRSWAPVDRSPDNLPFNRCAFYGCYQSGDFAHPAANPFATASMPFVFQNSLLATVMAQNFFVDPPGSAPGSFTPHAQPFPVGAAHEKWLAENPRGPQDFPALSLAYLRATHPK